MSTMIKGDRWIVFTGVASVPVHGWYWSVTLNYVHIFKDEGQSFKISAEDGARWRADLSEHELHIERFLWRTFEDFCSFVDMTVTSAHRQKYSVLWKNMIAEHQEKKHRQQQQQQQYEEEETEQEESEEECDDKEELEKKSEEKNALIDFSWDDDEEFWSGDLSSLN